MFPQAVPSPDFEVLEFEVLEEGWNEYELQNHTRVRGRVIVNRFVHDRNIPNPNAIHMSSQNIFVVDAPPEQRGAPSPLTPEEIANPNGVPVQVLTNNEKWNKYRIIKSGLIVKVKLVLHEAYRVSDRFDSDGMPAYVFTSGPLLIPDKMKNPNFKQ